MDVNGDDLCLSTIGSDEGKDFLSNKDIDKWDFVKFQTSKKSTRKSEGAPSVIKFTNRY